jgi:Heavy metal binding domain
MTNTDGSLLCRRGGHNGVDLGEKVDANQRLRGGAAHADLEGIRERRMAQRPNGNQVYLCPMHSDVRRAEPGKCPRCGMDLVPEGTRFGMLRHMISSPKHLVVMAAAMAALMVAAMMMMR